MVTQVGQQMKKTWRSSWFGPHVGVVPQSTSSHGTELIAIDPTTKVVIIKAAYSTIVGWKECVKRLREIIAELTYFHR